MTALERRFKILEKEKKHQTFHSLHRTFQLSSFHALCSIFHEESGVCAMSLLWGISFIISLYSQWAAIASES